ncbi:MAG: Amidase [Frankiales bacterium]|nr:Amidase [Frankiales bacterium]
MEGYLTIADAAAGLRAGDVTSRELVDAAFAAADQWEPLLGVYLQRFDVEARAAAAVADAELTSGIDRGPLHGIPLGIKDIIATLEGPTTAQSLVLDPEWTGDGDAPVVERLRRGGAVMVGKTTTCEFAIGFPDAEKPFPIPRNPWDTMTWPGGSSSGTGAGIPAGLFLGGLGSDTGGSIRIPAAYCGTTGLKATFGRVPKAGAVPLAYTLDGIGPMARSARDCALMLAVMAGPHPDDPTSSDRAVDDYVAALTGDLRGVRIGVDRLVRTGDAHPDMEGLVEDALRVLVDAGAQLVDVELPLYDELTTAQFITMTAESAAYHMPDLQSRWSDYGAGARFFVGGGALFTAPDYVQAQRIRRLGQKLVRELLTDVDFVVTPTSTWPAPTLASLDPVDPMASLRGLHTQYWNAVGNPTLSVPIGFTAEGLPMSLQISGRPFADADVLAVGDAFQRGTDWHLRAPQPALAVPA